MIAQNKSLDTMSNEMCLVDSGLEQMVPESGIKDIPIIPKIKENWLLTNGLEDRIIPCMIEGRDVNNKKISSFPYGWNTYDLNKLPQCNTVALKTGGGLLVIDIDTKDIVDDNLKTYIGKTFTIETTNGYHLYFTTNEVYKNKADKTNKIDIRSEGGVIYYHTQNNSCSYDLYNNTSLDLLELPMELRRYVTDTEQDSELIDYTRESFLTVDEVVDILKENNHWNEEHYPRIDFSADDLALANHIVYFCNGDYNVFEEVFSLHTFGARDKWKKRKDYREKTYLVAIRGKEKFYQDFKVSDKTTSKNPLDLLKGFAMTKEVIKRSKNQKYLYDGLIVKGFHHYLYGPAGAGKTTTAFYLMIEIAKNFKDMNFVFFYLDGALSMAAKMQEYVDENNFHNINILTEGSSHDYNEIMVKLKTQKLGLDKYVFIYDTFKYLSDDVNNKNANKKAMHLVKDLTKLGATFISLGHTNKDGKNNSGTAELEQDSDAMLRVDSKVIENTTVTSITKGGRCRMDFKECSFEYVSGDPTTVISLDNFVPIEEDVKTQETVDQIRKLLESKDMKQKEIESKISNIGRNKLLKILRDHENLQGYWKLTKGDKNSKIYSLFPFHKIEGLD